MFRRNCSTIKYRENGLVHFGQVRYFILYHDTHRGGLVRHLSLVQPLTCANYSPSSHISVISVGNQNPAVIFVDIESITENCIYISFLTRMKEPMSASFQTNWKWNDCLSRQTQDTDFLVGRSDYKFTLVFRIKAQSCAMGNTADMRNKGSDFIP